MSTRISVDDRIVVRAPSWLGDFIMAEPFVRALYEHHARAGNAERLTLAAPQRLLELFDGRFEGMRRVPSARGASESASAWRGNDVAILLNGSWRSAWAALHARIPLRAGFARGARGVCLTHAFTPAREFGGVPVTLGMHGAWPRFLPRAYGSSCVELAGWLGLPIRDPRPRLAIDPNALMSARAKLGARGIDAHEPFILVNAGARAGSAKGFPPLLLAAALDELARGACAPFVLACAPGEQHNARAVARACRIARTCLVDEPPLDLRELACVSAVAQLVLTTDSGPRHVAQAFGTPTLVVCGPTDPRHTAEHPANTRIVRTSVPCGPCHREVCPLSGAAHLACFERVGAHAIARATRELLAREFLEREQLVSAP